VYLSIGLMSIVERMLRTRSRARMRAAAASGSLAPDRLKLVVAPDGHLELAEPLAEEDAARARPKRAPSEVLSTEEAALSAANRDRIAALRKRRYGGVTSAGDLFMSPGGLSLVVLGIALAAKILVIGRVVPVVAGTVIVVACLALLIALTRRRRLRDRRALALRAAEDTATAGVLRSQRGHRA
jgi:hypothetical protein